MIPLLLPIREPGWERVERVMLEGVLTLDLSAKEIANALWKKVARNEMSYEVAVEVVRDIVENKALRMEPQENYLIDAFKIAVEAKVTVYDALFIALAKKKGLELYAGRGCEKDGCKSIAALRCNRRQSCVPFS